MELLSNALNTIKVCESRGKTACTVPGSKLVRQVFEVLQKSGYITSFEEVKTPEKSSNFVVKLSGKVNNCGAVRPRFTVRSTDWEKYEMRYLPSKGIGLLVVSTSKGVMNYNEAKQAKIGGVLLAFVY